MTMPERRLNNLVDFGHPMCEPCGSRRCRECNGRIGLSRLQCLEQAVRHHHVPDPGGTDDQHPRRGFNRDDDQSPGPTTRWVSGVVLGQEKAVTTVRTQCCFAWSDRQIDPGMLIPKLAVIWGAMQWQIRLPDLSDRMGGGFFRNCRAGGIH